MTPFEPQFDEILVAALRGEDSAWTAIYRHYSPAVLRYLAGRGARDAEDVLGEVFLQVVRDIRSFAGDERAFRTWVFTIAHSRLVDDLRASARNLVDAVPDEELVGSAGTGHAEDEAMARLSEAQMLSVLSGLTPDQRDVIFLRFFGRLTAEETGRILGKPVGAVKSLQSRGIAQIRKEISR